MIGEKPSPQIEQTGNYKVVGDSKKFLAELASRFYAEPLNRYLKGPAEKALSFFAPRNRELVAMAPPA